MRALIFVFFLSLLLSPKTVSPSSFTFSSSLSSPSSPPSSSSSPTSPSSSSSFQLVTTKDTFDIEKFRDFLYCAGRVTGIGLTCNWDIDCIFSLVPRDKRFQEVQERCLTIKHYQLDLKKFEEAVHHSPCGHYIRHPKSSIWLVVMIRNEVDDLLLYILHHALLGVNHFFIFDEQSTDGLREVLEDLINAGWVTYRKVQRKSQIVSYISAIDMGTREKLTWLGFLDADEFFFSQDHRCIPEFLLPHEKPQANISSVSINWMFMPGSLRITDPPSSTLFSLSGFCSEGEFNMHVKSFVRPERVDLSIVNPHYFGSKEGYSQVLYDGTPMNGPWSMKPDPRASVLHFRFKSFTKFIEKSHKGAADYEREHDYAKINVFGVGVEEKIGGGGGTETSGKRIGEGKNNKNRWESVGGEPGEAATQCRGKLGGEGKLGVWMKKVHDLFWAVVEMKEDYVGVKGVVERG